MHPSKYVVVEVTTTTATMTLVQYLITHGFDKFAVVSDLCDHPSLKYKSTGGVPPSSTSSTSRTSTGSSPSSTNSAITTQAATPTNGKARASINDIASALSKRFSPIEAPPPPTPPSNQQANFLAQMQRAATQPLAANNHTALSRILDEKRAQDKAKDMQNKEMEKQSLEIQRLILGQTQLLANNPFLTMDFDRRTPDAPNSPPEQGSDSAQKSEKPDTDTTTDVSERSPDPDFGLGPSDEQVRASMIHLLNPALGSAFGSSMVEQSAGATGGRKRASGGEEGSGPARKHRWMTTDELEESRCRSGRSKSQGRVHCKATYKCELCGKPTTLNSTGSRWNLLRHVIMLHSESKPYKCWDCDFIGIKSNVISHARQSGHRADDANDITTDAMRSDWNVMLHHCFPDYVKAKARNWEKSPVEVKSEPKEDETFFAAIEDEPKPIPIGVNLEQELVLETSIEA